MAFAIVANELTLIIACWLASEPRLYISPFVIQDIFRRLAKGFANQKAIYILASVYHEIEITFSEFIL